jgi:hypothetical protein
LQKSTQLTLELFLEWKARKQAKKEADANEKKAKKVPGERGAMSGREMFVFNPDLFVDDDAAMESDDLRLEAHDDGFVVEATATSLRRTHIAATTTTSSSTHMLVNGINVDTTLFTSLDGIPDLELD